MLVDDTGNPDSRTLEMLAQTTINKNWNGRVSAHHARALSFYPSAYYQKLKKLIKQAGISVVCNPHTGPISADVKDLYLSKINTALAQDSNMDAYYPFGRNNMLEVAFLTAHMLSMMTSYDLNILYDMITVNAAESMNINNYKIREGSSADFVILNTDNIREALLYHEAPQYVIKSGVIL
jgi:cytosine/creatinine deaminase